MKIPPEDQRHLTAAEGYTELGMFARAVTELEGISAKSRRSPKVLAVQLMIYQGLKEWSRAFEVAEKLCLREPEEGQHFLCAAFCLHEMKRTMEARTILLASPPTLRKNWVFHYNMACYDAQLGELASARAWLEIACKMHSAAKSEARHDPDLKPLWQTGQIR